MPTISAVVPCYNEEEALPLFVAEFQRVAESMREVHSDLRFELVLVDDGSQDGTLGCFKQLGGGDVQLAEGALDLLFS